MSTQPFSKTVVQQPFGFKGTRPVRRHFFQSAFCMGLAAFNLRIIGLQVEWGISAFGLGKLHLFHLMVQYIQMASLSKHPTLPPSDHTETPT